MPQKGIRQAPKYRSGDSVYIDQTRVNSTGIVKEEQTKDSSIGIIDNSEKCISGDYMVLLSESCDRTNANSNNKNVSVPIESYDSGFSNDANYEVSDNESVLSEDGDTCIPNIISNNGTTLNTISSSVNRRNYKEEHHKLHDSLSTTLPKSRTRSGTDKNVNRRKSKGEHHKLYDSLSTTSPVSRTRSGS